MIDTVGFLRALLNPFGAWGEIVFDHDHHYELIVSEHLVNEVADVLGRQGIVRRLSTFEGRNAAAVDLRLAAGRRVKPGEIERISRDPNDDYLIAMAVSGNARFVVTEDKDLLSIGDYRGISFVSGLTFLRYLRSLELG